MDHTRLRLTSKWLLALLLSIWVMGVARAQAPPTPAPTPTPTVSKPVSPTVEAAEPADKVVLKIGDQQFTKADMDGLVESLGPQQQRAVVAQGKKPLGDWFVFLVLLSRQAELHRLDQAPAFQRRLAMVKQQMEAQAASDEIRQHVQVTPDEIQQYYTAHAADYEEIMAR